MQMETVALESLLTHKKADTKGIKTTFTEDNEVRSLKLSELFFNPMA